MPMGKHSPETVKSHKRNRILFTSRVSQLLAHSALNIDEIAEQLDMRPSCLRKYLDGRFDRMRPGEKFDLRIDLLDDMIEEHVGPGQAARAAINASIDATALEKGVSPAPEKPAPQSSGIFKELSMFVIGVAVGGMLAFVAISVAL
jgi:hypothetical protein